MTDVVTNGTILGSAAEGKKSQRKFRYLVAVIGFVLVALELMLALDEVAVYQSLICSAYLLFTILIDVSAWTERYWTRKFGRKTNIAEGRLIFGAILISSWLLFNRLLGLIAPLFSYVVIWSRALNTSSLSSCRKPYLQMASLIAGVSAQLERYYFVS